MPYPEEDNESQGHEKELQLESILLEVGVPPDVVEQTDPTPPENIKVSTLSNYFWEKYQYSKYMFLVEYFCDADNTLTLQEKCQ